VRRYYFYIFSLAGREIFIHGKGVQKINILHFIFYDHISVCVNFFVFAVVGNFGRGNDVIVVYDDNVAVADDFIFCVSGVVRIYKSNISGEHTRITEK
jgi:hypothetical protein